MITVVAVAEVAVVEAVVAVVAVVTAAETQLHNLPAPPPSPPPRPPLPCQHHRGHCTTTATTATSATAPGATRRETRLEVCVVFLLQRVLDGIAKRVRCRPAIVEKKSVSPFVGRVLDVYWTMYGQQSPASVGTVRVIGPNSHQR